MKKILKLSILAMGISALTLNLQAMDHEATDVSFTKTIVSRSMSDMISDINRKSMKANNNRRINGVRVSNPNHRFPVNFQCLSDSEEVISNLENNPNYFPANKELRSLATTALAVRRVINDRVTYTTGIPSDRTPLTDYADEVCILERDKDGSTPLTNVRYVPSKNLLIAQDIRVTNQIVINRMGAEKQIAGSGRIVQVSIADLINTFNILASSNR